MLLIIITGIAVYAVVGWAFHIIVKDYLHELSDKLAEHDIHNSDQLVFHAYGPIWFGLLVLCLSTVFWPITIIAVILKAEWNYSKLTQG